MNRLFRLAAALLLCLSAAQAQEVRTSAPALPLSAANGGTGTAGGAWTPYTPSATCGQSTGTAVCTMAGSYTIVDKRIWFTATNTVTGTFTVGTFGNFTLPFTPATRAGAVWTLSGAETGATGMGWTGWAVSNNVTAFARSASAGGTTIVTGYIVTISGTYELP